MSRSWERMVERNSKQINKRRKKEGKGAIAAPAQQIDRFQGRSYIVPTLLVLLAVLIVLISQPWSEAFQQTASMFWVTVGLYLLLAVFYYLRRPYLAVGKDFLETRRFSGYKRLKPTEIRKLVQQPGYIIVETVKGGNWVFSRFMNRFPIEKMGERLHAFATLHHIEWELKSK
ncbi:hypothetical protein J19TS2_10740 [Cohnella xylanilytica]|uniref:PH (Pleckstrin Homology) domain-containing protein n=1 Tax=Cohnella xylanilytica TaxID=557555 RepID=A0A841TZ04_9BACL|nr:hypothetical protein [Cohnella xylanilytica]MBB6691151.1 hypothetical protein [Cohnella xylanilytica]GIO11519.1 hypothetical protein J19TS2_10740 [Cohnella xylanilytica]